ncbi:MAG TPA: hypothetical protein DCZ23_04340 [Lachnospiraceae bacterium]|nr:hypothetical protein [Lachnospiraceae bacterium]
MKIGGAGIVDAQQYSGTMNQTAVDAETKSFQTQIASAQTQLQKLSANREMSSEEKAEKRQEIQKRIMELNNMLREHKMEMRREKQQQAAEEAAKSANAEQQKGQQQDSQDKSVDAKIVEEKPQITETQGISSKRMKSIVAADSTVSRVKAQENISNNLESRMRILETEIKQATHSGGYVDAKKGELESLENKVERISGAKMNIIGSAIQEMKQVTDEENRKDAKSGIGQNGNTKEPAELPSKDFTTKKQVDMYTKGKMFSNVDIHF